MLDLDAPVTRYLPDFAPRNPFEDADHAATCSMSHRSGLVREPPVGHYFDPSSPPLAEVVQSLDAHHPGLSRPAPTRSIRTRGSPSSAPSWSGCGASRFPQRFDGPCSIRSACRDRASSPAPSWRSELALGVMWTYDGQTVATPTFLLGTGPAGNLVSTVNDLGRLPELPLRRRARSRRGGRQARDPPGDA